MTIQGPINNSLNPHSQIPEESKSKEQIKKEVAEKDLHQRLASVAKQGVSNLEKAKAAPEVPQNLHLRNIKPKKPESS